MVPLEMLGLQESHRSVRGEQDAEHQAGPLTWCCWGHFGLQDHSQSLTEHQDADGTGLDV